MEEIKVWHIGIGIMGMLLLMASLAAGCPQYTVYASERRGRAAYVEAEWSKKVAIEDARAKKDSASMLAEAEVERAKGVAEANKIIGDSLEDNEGYLRYLWIQGLQNDNATIVYVPTEAGLPLLEAGRLPESP